MEKFPFVKRQVEAWVIGNLVNLELYNYNTDRSKAM